MADPETTIDPAHEEKLLAAGLTPEEIAAATPEEIAALASDADQTEAVADTTDVPEQGDLAPADGFDNLGASGPDLSPAPPIDNEHVAPGAEQFDDATIAMNAAKAPEENPTSNPHPNDPPPTPIRRGRFGG